MRVTTLTTAICGLTLLGGSLKAQQHVIRAWFQSTWDATCTVRYGPNLSQTAILRQNNGGVSDQQYSTAGPGAVKITMQNLGGKGLEFLGCCSIEAHCQVWVDGKQVINAMKSEWKPQNTVFDEGWSYSYGSPVGGGAGGGSVSSGGAPIVLYVGEVLNPNTALTQVTPLANVTPLNNANPLTQVTPLANVTPLTDTSPLVNNGDPLTANTGGALVGNSGGMQPSDFTMPIGNNFALNGRTVSGIGDANPVLAFAFRQCLGRDPNAAERSTWLRLLGENRQDGRVQSTAYLEGTLMATLRLPQSESLRSGLIQAAFQSALRRAPTAAEYDAANKQLQFQNSAVRLRYVDLQSLLGSVTLAYRNTHGPQTTPPDSVYAWWIARVSDTLVHDAYYSSQYCFVCAAVKNGAEMSKYMQSQLRDDPAEKRATLARAFREAVKREATAADFQRIDQWAGRSDYSTLVNWIRNSTPSNETLAQMDAITAVFRDLLGREPRQNETQQWLPMQAKDALAAHNGLLKWLADYPGLRMEVMGRAFESAFHRKPAPADDLRKWDAPAAKGYSQLLCTMKTGAGCPNPNRGTSGSATRG